MTLWNREDIRNWKKNVDGYWMTLWNREDTRNWKKNVGGYWMTLWNRQDIRNWKKNTRSYRVENPLWKGLRNCRKRDNMKNEWVDLDFLVAPIWTYGLEVWSCASKSNIEIIQRFQSKLLRATVNAPWYLTNAMIHSDLGIPTVQDVIHDKR